MRALLSFLSRPRATHAMLSGLCFTALLAACGGGGGSSGAAPPATFEPSATLANLCAIPRSNTVDRQGTVAQEKAFLRSFIHENYLWYQEVPDPDPASFATVQHYFDALKTLAVTPSGKAVDRFHFWDYTADWDATSSGLETEYGIRWLVLSENIPRNWVVAYVAPGSPAAFAGVKRGDRLTAIDRVDLVYGRSDQEIATLNGGLFSAAGVPHLFSFNNAPDIFLAKAQYAYTTVHDVKTVQSGAATTGYFRFDRHVAGSEAELASAIQQLQAARVTDLVIDMRYNGGGLLRIANQLAYMVAGPTRTQGKIFERLIYSDKRSSENYSFLFDSTDTNNQALPHLDLPRVTLLVSDDTASASESVINSLRGVDLQVDLIGKTTRGKPYGFVPQDNCGFTYFAIEFKGINDKGFGDYTDGFAPTCTASDDTTHALGDTAENMLATALSYRQTGICPVVAGAITATAVANAFAGPRAQAFRAARPGAAAGALQPPDAPDLRILKGMRP